MSVIKGRGGGGDPSKAQRKGNNKTCLNKAVHLLCFEVIRHPLINVFIHSLTND